MTDTTINTYSRLGISYKSVEKVMEAEKELTSVFKKIEEVEYINQLKVLSAFQNEGIALRHFSPTTGYGYDDIGRDTLDKVFACSLDANDAIVRPQIANGTQAIFLALAGLLEPGDVMLSISGKPYDTLEKAIGIRGNEYSSLKRLGIRYEQIDLLPDGKIDINKVIETVSAIKPKVAYVQRSRGYSWRNSLLPKEDMEEVFKEIHSISDQTIIVVDNCYGEFTRVEEPTTVGADIQIGSLIKNPGGGIAPSGGYIAGKEEFIERICQRLTSPGTGREVGAYPASYRPFYQGLFMAPSVTASSLKTAALFAKLFENLGLETMPASDAARSDIVQALRFKTAQELITFCQSIQKASPVDSFAVPMPWDMPGYTNQVIMASGSFVQGSSIELSADAPIKEPYTAYVQGSLTYAHGRLGAMIALDAINSF